jgi:hypothetical protein
MSEADPLFTALDAMINTLPNRLKLADKITGSSNPLNLLDSINPESSNLEIRYIRVRAPARAAESLDSDSHGSPRKKTGSLEFWSLSGYGVDIAGVSTSTRDSSFLADSRKVARWHLNHGERVPRDTCAGCRCPFRRDDKILDLADNNRVHLAAGYGCLIAWGKQWRRAARDAVARSEASASDPPTAPRSKAIGS